MKPLLLLCLLLAAAAISARESDAREILERREYAGYRVVPDERAGGGDPTVRRDVDDRSGREAREAGSRADTPMRDRPRREPREPISLPTWVGELFKALAWIVLIVGVAVMLFLVIRALLGIRRAPRKPKARKTKAESAGAAVAADEPLDAPEDAPAPLEEALAAARREYEEALSRGDFAKAALLSYRIFWLEAGWQGCVREDDVRTWRDALRMIRATELRNHVRELLGLIERVRYGGHRPPREEFTDWKRRLDSIPPGEALR